MSQMKNGTMNVIEGFDPALCRVKENESVPLEVQLLWFRLAYPKGRLIQKVVQLSDKLAIMEARLYLECGGGEDACVSSCFGMAVRKSGDLDGEFIRQAENTAASRALFSAGFGPQCVVDNPGIEAPKRIMKTKQKDTPAAEAAAEKAETAEESVSEVAGVKEASAPESPVNLSAESASQAVPTELITPAAVETASEGETVESIMASMTLQEAVKLTVEVGAAKGKTIGQIAKEDPRQLFWFRDSYKGPDNRLRAAAALLLKEAGAADAGTAEAAA